MNTKKLEVVFKIMTLMRAIRFDTRNKSFKMGSIKVSWEELLDIVKSGTGSDYKFELDDY